MSAPDDRDGERREYRFARIGFAALLVFVLVQCVLVVKEAVR